MDLTHNPWKTLSKKSIYENPWITVEEHQVTNPRGGNGIYGVVHFKNKAIGIVPVDQHMYTWLVGQYRYALDAYSWEIPMGGGPHSEDPLATAARELKEETGLVASSFTLLTKIHTSNSVTDEVGYIFLAEGLEITAPEPDETEVLQLWHLPLQQAIEMVMNHTITDSLSIAGLLAVARLKEL
jgi:8-oxo-dGTP pyrophosphatase MutT (NUDIX family)